MVRERELQPTDLDQKTGRPISHRPSREQIDHLLQEAKDKTIKHEARLEVLCALDDVRRTGRDISQIDPNDSLLGGAKEFWLTNARTIVRTTDPHAYLRAVREAERTGQKLPPEDQSYQEIASALFNTFIGAVKATHLKKIIQIEGEIIQSIGDRVMQKLTQTISPPRPTTSQELDRMVAKLNATKQQEATAPTRLMGTEHNHTAYLEENRRRQTSCSARLRLFYAFRRIFLVHEKISNADPIFDSVKNFHIAHAKDIVPHHDFQIACEQAREQELPIPIEAEFFKGEALRLFYRDFEVARKFALREVRIPARTVDLDWLIFKEQETVREARKHRIVFAHYR